MRFFFIVPLLVVLGVMGWTLYQEHEFSLAQSSTIEKLESRINELHERFSSAVTAPTASPAPTPVQALGWNDIQTRIKNTVVQIFAHGAQFNWLEPYKTPQQFQAMGTGFFVNPEGAIMTNAHVINEAKALFIQLPQSFGKRRFEVEIMGVSPERDLALLRLKPEELVTITRELGTLPYLALGNSDSVHRADDLLTLGYPLGQQSLKSTTGVVSGQEHVDGHSLIQISAAINPGSSGGPSLDGQGNVIGVTVSGVTNAQNVGYVIPSNEVKLFLHQLDYVPALVDGVKFLRKPFLGVVFCNATEQLTDFLHNPAPGGMYVVEIYQGSPLHKIGVQSGDMIYEIDGHKIDLFGEMSVPWSEDRISIIDYVGRRMLSDTIRLLVYRKGKPHRLTLTFSQSELAPVRVIYPAYEKIDYEVLGGIVFMQLAINHLPLLLPNAPELARYMELKHQMEPAIVITHVFPDSVAARTRTIGPGAIIKEINGMRVKTLDEVRAAIKKSTETGFLTLKTVENLFTVMNMADILQQEPRLSAQYYYDISPLVEQLSSKP